MHRSACPSPTFPCVQPSERVAGELHFRAIPLLPAIAPRLARFFQQFAPSVPPLLLSSGEENYGATPTTQQTALLLPMEHTEETWFGLRRRQPLPLQQSEDQHQHQLQRQFCPASTQQRSHDQMNPCDGYRLH